MSFLQRDVAAFGRSRFRLGLAPNYGIDEAGIREGMERGIDYFFYAARRGGALKKVIREMKPSERERVMIASTPTVGFFGWSVTSGLESLLKTLKTDYLDVLQLGWVGVGSAYTEGTVEALTKLKAAGKVRHIGCSIHDRPRAGKLAEDSPLDLLMIRYNAAHPGAEREIFPMLEKRHPAVVAFTATRWGKLLKKPSGWEGPVPTAGDCYRFCLSNPHVDMVLTGPKSRAELVESLDVLEKKGELSAEEDAWMRAFGKAVHG